MQIVITYNYFMTGLHRQRFFYKKQHLYRYIYNYVKGHPIKHAKHHSRSLQNHVQEISNRKPFHMSHSHHLNSFAHSFTHSFAHTFARSTNIQLPKLLLQYPFPPSASPTQITSRPLFQDCNASQKLPELSRPTGVLAAEATEVIDEHLCVDGAVMGK